MMWDNVGGQWSRQYWNIDPPPLWLSFFFFYPCLCDKVTAAHGLWLHRWFFTPFFMLVNGYIEVGGLLLWWKNVHVWGLPQDSPHSLILLLQLHFSTTFIKQFTFYKNVQITKSVESYFLRTFNFFSNASWSCYFLKRLLFSFSGLLSLSHFCPRFLPAEASLGSSFCLLPLCMFLSVHLHHSLTAHIQKSLLLPCKTIIPCF